MLDWSKIFNIAFVAGAGALGLFFLVSTIVVAVKGKRKCNAFDVILRILSALAFIASTAMFACAILTMLKGDVCITLADNAATLVFFDKSVQLPLVDLFVLLSTAIGSELAIALFICSLAALIVDCLVANKKTDKKSKAKAAVGSGKTPEQIKRAAELERIRRIGESAVKKTDAAASHAAKVDADKAVDDEPQTDWRAEPTAEPANSGFVGITENADNDFDTFDDVSDDTSNDTENAQSGENAETPDKAFDDVQASENAETESVADDLDNFDEQAESDTSDAVVDDISDDDTADTADAVPDLTEFADRSDDAIDVGDSEPDGAERVWNEPDDESGDGAYAEMYDDTAKFDTADVREMPEYAENVDAYADRGYARPDEYDDVEPDRGIYIPEIRTITKSGDDDASEKPAPRARSSSGNGKKPTQKKTPSTPAKRAASESAATGVKQSTRGKASATSRIRKNDKTDGTPTEKKLPVTRRYVILDRRNAVNMFGDYLRERSSAEKEKLQSSINTIIIE